MGGGKREAADAYVERAVEHVEQAKTGHKAEHAEEGLGLVVRTNLLGYLLGRQGLHVSQHE